MAYATQADLDNRLTHKRLVELTDFDGSGELNAARVTEALAVAGAEIDAYAAGRYLIPLAQSKQVNDLCLRIAIYRLYANRQRAIPDTVSKDRDDAVALLKDVASGKASLDQPAATQTTEMNVVKRDHDTKPEVFDETKITGF
ncbi:MAG: DUF1320 domain-containing protein [Acidobacteriia bacterium]|nr:DUF1320 domain-containing protein [Terriglobia bacterium]